MNQIAQNFLKNGWVVLDFPRPEPLFEARHFLQNLLTDYFKKEIPLEEYHLHMTDDQEHTELQIRMTQAFRQKDFATAIFSAQIELFKSFIGLDLSIQAQPYLRITRPHCPQDNIGYHRDTFYGGSPYELSVLVPFVDLPKESSLSVLTGSHIQPEDFYPTRQIENPDQAVRKGTPKHQLGFLYAPKMMDETIEELMEAIPLKVGQALLFSLSTVHGSRINSGTISRWSSDMRIMNSLAPVDLSMRPDYYKPLSQSVVTEAAKKYFQSQSQVYEQERRNHVELELCHTASGK